MSASHRCHSEVCLHYVDRETGEPLSDRDSLRSVNNGWLYPGQIERARRIALSGTDEECTAFLKSLESDCNSALSGWRSYQ